MLVGIDLDNTIVCYDQIFHTVCVERGLIPAEVPATKGAVRDHLRATGREGVWIEMQGYVYGPGLARADAFPGVWKFIRACVDRGISVNIVSHKTLHPFSGPKYDLHASALDWLKRETEAHNLPLEPGSEIFLEPTKAAKLARIGALGCDWFIDDLPEFLAEPDFPPRVKQVLFDPSGSATPTPSLRHARSWQEIGVGFFGAQPWPGVHG